MTTQHTKELDERISDGGTRVTLVWYDGENGLSDPETLVLVYEGYEAVEPTLVVPVAPESALDAFWHPYAYAGR